MMDASYYEQHEAYPSYALYPADFNMPGRPTLPPISALIPRQGTSSASSTSAPLLPSPLPPSAQIYAGHTSPVYAYPETVTSPRSGQAGTPSPMSPGRMQQQQQQAQQHPSHHAQPMLHYDEYGQSYYAMPAHPLSAPIDDHPPSPFMHFSPGAAPKIESPVPPADGSDAQHGGINDLLHAATTTAAPVIPNNGFYGQHPHRHSHMSRQGNVSPMPPVANGSHHGTPVVSPAGPPPPPGMYHPQYAAAAQPGPAGRRPPAGRRGHAETEGEYMEQLSDSSVYFKRPPMLTAVQ